MGLRVRVSGLARRAWTVSNALVALSGALLSQYQGFADVGMGRGAIVIGLAAVIIGEAVFGRIFHNFALKMVSVSLGAIIYYIVIQLVLTLGFDANLLKLLSASVVGCDSGPSAQLGWCGDVVLARVYDAVLTDNDVEHPFGRCFDWFDQRIPLQGRRIC